MPLLVKSSGATLAPFTRHGTSGADAIYGADFDEHIYGYGGNDSLKGFGGADHLDGGTGTDTAFYGDSAVGVSVNLATGRGYGGSAEGDTLVSIENVFGSYYNDTLTGTDGNNELYGLEGNDVLKGGGGADGLAGDRGDDILKGGGGADYLEGGPGSDTVDYSNSPAGYYGTYGVYVDLQANQAFYGHAEGDTFSGIEHVTGSPFNDSLTGTDGNNRLRGLDGIDGLYGLGGNDILEGGGGNDYLRGGPGADTMIGETEDDVYYVDDPGDVAIEAAGQGTSDKLVTSISYALAPDCEIEIVTTDYQLGTADIALTGSNFNNNLTGNAGANVIEGRDGHDTLTGWTGNDSLSGGDGSDALIGGGGLDVLFGGNGLDYFYFTHTSDTGMTLGTADVVLDFSRGEGDVLHLANIDADIYADGNQAFTFIGAGPFLGTPGEVNYIHAGGDTYIQLQTGTSADVEAVIRLPGIHIPEASWFVL